MGGRIKTISKKQKAFADEYIKTGNGQHSALKAGYNVVNPKTAAVIATENLSKPNVIEYLKGQAQAAAERINELSIKAKNETVRLNANKDILDRSVNVVQQQTQQINFSLSVLFEDKEEVRDITNDQPK